MDRLKDKVAVITGGAGGIGLAIAQAFAREGAHVVVADLSLERCEVACRSIEGPSTAVALNVQDLSSIDAMVKRTAQINGRIDVLINCAGIWEKQDILEITPEAFDRMIGVNLRGLLFTLAAVARVMAKEGTGGAIVNIASAAGRRGSTGSGAYSASKAGVISLTQTAAQELAPMGIRVNAIAPGGVKTAMLAAVQAAYRGDDGQPLDMEASLRAITPAGRLAVAEDCAGAALFLACDESAFVLGQTINVDGGFYMN